jgi:hypothetical protein
MNRQHIVFFTDPGSFLAALSPLREATFHGRDLVCDASGVVTLTLASSETAARRLGRQACQRVIVTVRGARNYRQSLTAGPDGVYVLDRAEIGRGGREIAFYFRPGDRAVMDVEAIDGSVRRTGEEVPPHERPAIVNPLAAAPRSTGLLARLLGR